MTKVIGMKYYKSKKTDKVATILSCVTEYDDFENGIGKKATEIYVNDQLDCELLDKNVNIIYGVGFQGKAVVKGIEVIKQ